MNDQTMAMQHNKHIRGYIMRMLVKSPQYTLLCHQISQKLIYDRMTGDPDISPFLNYLAEKKYIQFVGKNTAYTTYANDLPVSLTASGIDLVESSIEDPGVDI
jgi:hypothetical protein